MTSVKLFGFVMGLVKTKGCFKMLLSIYGKSMEIKRCVLKQAGCLKNKGLLNSLQHQCSQPELLLTRISFDLEQEQGGLRDAHTVLHTSKTDFTEFLFDSNYMERSRPAFLGSGDLLSRSTDILLLLESECLLLCSSI
jgi:hypothetical protein